MIQGKRAMANQEDAVHMSVLPTEEANPGLRPCCLLKLSISYIFIVQFDGSI